MRRSQHSRVGSAPALADARFAPGLRPCSARRTAVRFAGSVARYAD